MAEPVPVKPGMTGVGGHQVRRPDARRIDQNAAVSVPTIVEPAIDPLPSWPREKLG